MWNIVQCAVQGKGHISSNTPCQDKTYAINTKEVQVIALADGAGSAKLSHFGAECVTKEICKALSEKFDLYYDEPDGVAVKRKIISDLLDSLEEVAKNNNCDIKDLASTLLVVAIKDGKYIISHIGDGVIGYLKNNELKVASMPENGEFVNTTTFVTSKNVLQTMKIIKGKLGAINGFALMSDGTEVSFYDKRSKTLALIVKKLMEYTKILNVSCLEKDIKNSFEEVVKENTNDDCSLVLLVKDDSTFKGYKFLTKSEKRELFDFEKSFKNKMKIKRIDTILNFLETPRELEAIAKKIWSRKSTTIKYLELLLSKNFILKDENLYQVEIRMDK